MIVYDPGGARDHAKVMVCVKNAWFEFLNLMVPVPFVSDINSSRDRPWNSVYQLVGKCC